MQDAVLRELERACREAPEDYSATFRLRLALIRAGRADELKLTVGDIIQVEEVESPWIRGTWVGEVLRVFPDGDLNVKPRDYDQTYRVKPSKEYYTKGLYLTREDKRVIIEPVSVERYEALAPTRAEHARLDIEIAKEKAERERIRAEQQAAQPAEPTPESGTGA